MENKDTILTLDDLQKLIVEQNEDNDVELCAYTCGVTCGHTSTT